MRVAGLGTRAYPYTHDVTAIEAVTLATLKLHLRISGTSQDTVLQLYLDAAISYAQECTGLTLGLVNYTTYRDYFPIEDNEGYYPFGLIPETFNADGGNTGFELTRSPIGTITSIEYEPLSALGTLVTIAASNYYLVNAEAGKFGKVLAKPEYDWPNDLVNPRVNSIKIIFTAGYASTALIPADIRTAILLHAANLFANRGDCGTCTNKAGAPVTSMAIYAKHRVIRL